MSEEVAAEPTTAPETEPTTVMPRPVDVTRLVHEAASKSGVLWVRVPGGGTHPVWFAWHDDGDPRGPGPAAYIVSGPGEQSLPWLPEEVEVLFRSKDDGGRLLAVHASARELTPEHEDWDAAVQVLRPERLNATGDVAQRWAQSCTIHVVTPHGRLVEGPGAHVSGSGAAPVHPAGPTTTGWRPWHWHGRSRARRSRPDSLSE
jgi:hypothetical protein